MVTGSSGKTGKAKRKAEYIKNAKPSPGSDGAESTPCWMFWKYWRSAKDVGDTHGVGVGLYLRLLIWLMLMFLLLAVASVPYMVTISTAVFTDADHKGDPEYGVTVYPKTQLSSFTFGAIVSSSLDNNTLTYMNMYIANKWQRPMRKSCFLKWVSYVDAGVSFLILLVMIFVKYVAWDFCDTLDPEVSSFTVVVRGLPRNATSVEVKDYFKRFCPDGHQDGVVEVHLIRDMGWILDGCVKMNDMQQRIQLRNDNTAFADSPGGEQGQPQPEVAQQVQQQAPQADAAMPPSILPVKVAFVTFENLESVDKCLKECPSGSISSWLFMKDANRFPVQADRRVDALRGHRFWVNKASPPEDYLYENFTYSRLSRYSMRVLTGLLLLAFALGTAVAIAALSNLDISNNSSVWWRSEQLREDAQSAISSLRAPLGLPHNSSFSSDDVKQVCSAALTSTCTSYWSSRYGDSLRMSFGSLLHWDNVTEELLNRRPLLKAMQSVQLGGASAERQPAGGQRWDTNATYAACLPCHCLGLELSPHEDDPAWRTYTTMECSPYIRWYKLLAWGVTLAIATLIFFLNVLLKVVLRVLLAFQKHWTRSGQGWWYAFLSFAAKLVNSAAVLLLVNAAQLKEASLSRGGFSQNVIQEHMLNGQFGDFNQLWYDSVGKAILVFVVISSVSPIVSLILAFLWRFIRQCCTVHCMKYDVQQRYNEAYARPDFNLQERVSDILLSVTLALMFGSGMPMLYVVVLGSLIIQNVVDNLCIARLYQVSSRYAEQLPTLIINWLPWALLLHCCFGIWMHTYFLVDDGDDAPSVLLSGARAYVVNLITGSAGANSADNLNEWHHSSLSSLVKRITQPNGQLLLIITGLVAGYLFLCYVYSFLIRIWFGQSGLKALDHGLQWYLFYAYGAPVQRGTYQRVLPKLAAELRRACRAIGCTCLCTQEEKQAAPPTLSYVSALNSTLKGAPTYRIQCHPAYEHIFAGQLCPPCPPCPPAKDMWDIATGPQDYTRLEYDADNRKFSIHELQPPPGLPGQMQPPGEQGP